MSYTLRGRLESRLAALLPVLVVAAALAVGLHRWWPLELAALMAGIGLTLDAEVYHRLLPYQPGWAALPLGALELGLVIAAAQLTGVRTPLGGALALYVAAWLVAQLLGHALLPLLRLGYAQEGGELGRTVAALGIAAATLLASAGGVAWASRPPIVHLAAGIHQGPLVISREETLQGEPGAIVRGGIVIRASGVTVRDVAVVGGENGIDVDGVQRVRLEHVSVSGAGLDGIHVRRSAVTITDCMVDSGSNPWAQGIDISYGFDKQMSMVRGCTVTGGREGITAHFVQAMLVDNHVSRTSFHGIAMTEMSMGGVEGNSVTGSRGVGIYCGDHSMCMVERNAVADTRPDMASGDLTLRGYGILSHYGSHAELKDNHLARNPAGVGAILDSRSERLAK